MGKTVNTNLTYIAKSLHTLGVEISKAMCTTDTKKSIIQALNETEDSLIILTGGLGPTPDDMTKEVVCDYFNLELVEHESSLEAIKQTFARMGKSMNNYNLKQARFPKEAIVLANKNGTAPGAIIQVEDKTVVLLPGPPSELKPMFTTVLAYLEERLDIKVYQEGFLVVGIGESEMQARLGNFYVDHKDVIIAPYAGLGEIQYIFTTSNKKALEKALDAFKKKFDDVIVGPYYIPLEARVVELLMLKNLTISFAESCTAGLLAGRLVNVADASKVFNESYVLYSNESKIKQLGVNQQIIDKFGAVSDQCVYELAYQLAQRTDADITVSVSGIAGPSGGTAVKPIGTVYIGIHYDGLTKTYHRVFTGDRQMVRDKATTYALGLVYDMLTGKYEDKYQ